MQNHAIPCNIMQPHAIPCTTMQYHAIPCNTMQYNAIPCNDMQYHASLITADGAYHCPVGSMMAIFFNARQKDIKNGSCKWSPCVYDRFVCIRSKVHQKNHKKLTIFLGKGKGGANLKRKIKSDNRLTHNWINIVPSTFLGPRGPLVETSISPSVRSPAPSGNNFSLVHR